MKSEEFIKRLIEEMKYIQNKVIIEDSRSEDDKDKGLYADGDITFIFNCAAYEVIRQEWDKGNKQMSLVAEDPVGRGAYSDILVKIGDRKNEYSRSYIKIEHENNPETNLKEKGIKQIRHCINKLAKNDNKAEYNLLVTYYYGKYTKEILLNEVKEIFNEIKEKKSDFKLYLVYADWEELNYESKQIH